MKSKKKNLEREDTGKAFVELTQLLQQAEEEGNHMSEEEKRIIKQV